MSKKKKNVRRSVRTRTAVNHKQVAVPPGFMPTAAGKAFGAELAAAEKALSHPSSASEMVIASLNKLLVEEQAKNDDLQKKNVTLQSDLANTTLWLQQSQDEHTRTRLTLTAERQDALDLRRDALALRQVIDLKTKSIVFAQKLLLETNARMEILAKPISAVTQDKDGLPIKVDVLTDLAAGTRSVTIMSPLANPPKEVTDATDLAQQDAV